MPIIIWLYPYALSWRQLTLTSCTDSVGHLTWCCISRSSVHSWGHWMEEVPPAIIVFLRLAGTSEDHLVQFCPCKQAKAGSPGPCWMSSRLETAQPLKATCSIVQNKLQQLFLCLSGISCISVRPLPLMLSQDTAEEILTLSFLTPSGIYPWSSVSLQLCNFLSTSPSI